MASASTPNLQTESSDMDLTSIAGQSPFNLPHPLSSSPICRKLSYGMEETQLVEIIKRAVTESVGQIVRAELNKARHQVGSECTSCQRQNLNLDTKPSPQHLRHPSKIPVRSSTPRQVPTPRPANLHTRSNSINPQFTLGHRNNQTQEHVPRIQNPPVRPQRHFPGHARSASGVPDTPAKPNPRLISRRPAHIRSASELPTISASSNEQRRIALFDRLASSRRK